MKEQRFFSVTVIFTDQEHGWGRNVLESWLQFFFNSELRGKDLARHIGNKDLFLVSIKNNLKEERWWENSHAVIKII